MPPGCLASDDELVEVEGSFGTVLICARPEVPRADRRRVRDLRRARNDHRAPHDGRAEPVRAPERGQRRPAGRTRPAVLRWTGGNRCLGDRPSTRQGVRNDAAEGGRLAQDVDRGRHRRPRRHRHQSPLRPPPARTRQPHRGLSACRLSPPVRDGPWAALCGPETACDLQGDKRQGKTSDKAHDKPDDKRHDKSARAAPPHITGCRPSC